MGFDTWGSNQNITGYLKGCSDSSKYKKGLWYCLADESNTPVSSCIIYYFSPTTAGIGSIATPPNLRNKGLASLLVQKIIQKLKNEGIQSIFLYSDISPKFYENLGFFELPKPHQKTPDTICMAWGTPICELMKIPNFSPPDYF